MKTFAQHLAEYNQIDHVIPCANGTDALQIALMALGLQPGDEVIVPVHTYVATAEVIALLHLEPIFVDCVADRFTIDVSKIEGKSHLVQKPLFRFIYTGNAQIWNHLWILPTVTNFML